MTPQQTPDAITAPLKPVVFEILLALRRGERHGYGLVKLVEERTEGQLRIEPANLYRTLRVLLEQGLIEESDHRPDPELDDQRRRYFRITALGVQIAETEAKRLQRLVADAQAHDLLPR